MTTGCRLDHDVYRDQGC